MRFNIPSKTLLSHLTTVSKVVNSKNAISILDNFLFSLNENEIVITGSDQETTLTTKVGVFDAEGGGRFAVNVKCLLDLLKELPDQVLTFDINEDNFEIVINYLNGQFNFVGINGDEFPEKKKASENAMSFTISSKETLNAIEQTVFAVGTDDLRPVMMGILWDIKPNEVTFVASDTHKLVRYINKKIATGIDASFILPTKPAQILRSILGKSDGEVNVTIDETSATFELSYYSLNCRFVNGKYPNYNSVIPQNNPYSLDVDRLSLLNAVRRVSVFASVGGLVEFEVRENQVFLRTQDVDFSTSAEEKVACEYNGDSMLIGFHGARVIEVLNNLDADTISLKLSDPSRAGIFLPLKQKEDEDILVLLMPIMI